MSEKDIKKPIFFGEEERNLLKDLIDFGLTPPFKPAPAREYLLKVIKSKL